MQVLPSGRLQGPWPPLQTCSESWEVTHTQLRLLLLYMLSGQRWENLCEEAGCRHHTWMEILHMQLNLCSIRFAPTRNILHILLTQNGSLCAVSDIRVMLLTPTTPTAGTRQGSEFANAGFQAQFSRQNMAWTIHSKGMMASRLSC
jgi:hypothetical protein